MLLCLEDRWLVVSTLPGMGGGYDKPKKVHCFMGLVGWL